MFHKQGQETAFPVLAEGFSCNKNPFYSVYSCILNLILFLLCGGFVSSPYTSLSYGIAGGSSHSVC